MRELQITCFPVSIPKAKQDHWHLQPAQTCSPVSCLALAMASFSFTQPVADGW